MRILFLGAHFPRPNNQTIGVWALSQVEALRSAGHEITVISPVPAIPKFVARLLKRGSSSDCPPRYRWGEIEASYVRWPLFPVGPMAKYIAKRPDVWVRLAWFLSARRFLKLAEEFRPDVIHAHHGQLSGLIASELSRRLGVPFFITEHSFGEIESCGSNAYRHKYYRGMVSRVSQWIAVSNRMRDTMLKLFPGAPALTIHNGGERLPANLDEVPRPAHLSGCVVILSACFFYKRKNVPALIDAFDAIAGRHPTARLVIVGNGDDQEAVDAAVARSKHPSQIIACGHVSHAEVLQYTVWSDVVASIAIHEPFATVFSDALMAGKPIIYSSDCGITDVVQHGVHGLSVKPGDREEASAAMETLLNDAPLRQRLGTSARQMAESSLTWNMNVARMSELFSSAGRPPG